MPYSQTRLTDCNEQTGKSNITVNATEIGLVIIDSKCVVCLQSLPCVLCMCIARKCVKTPFTHITQSQCVLNSLTARIKAVPESSPSRGQDDENIFTIYY